MYNNKIKRCGCGCGNWIIWKEYHIYYGIPKYISGHNPHWNKGLTKYSDKRIMKYSEIMIKNNPMKKKETREKSSKSHKGKFCGKKHPLWNKTPSEETKKKISEANKKNFDLNYIKNEYLFNTKSTLEISRELNCSCATICSRLRELNIPIRKKITDRTRNIHKKRRAKQIIPKKDSSIEVKIQNFLKKLGIEFFTHQYIGEIKHSYRCDILIPSMNLVIECDGDYWHKYPIGKELDHIRTKELIEKGFKVLRLWEHEIRIMDINEFKDKLEEVN